MSDTCPVKLYHGTSTIFLPGILENGLGATNVVKEWGILDLARDIFPLVQKEHSDHTYFNCFKEMVDQSCKGVSWNFQHGDVYLSASPRFAAEHPSFRKWGSEILTHTLTFVQVLLNAENPQIKLILAKYPKAKELLTATSEPILIELDGISYENLLSEDGKPVQQDYKDNLKNFSEKYPDNDEFLQIFKYRLKSVIPQEKFKVYKIEGLNTNYFDFKYKLIPYEV